MCGDGVLTARECEEIGLCKNQGAGQAGVVESFSMRSALAHAHPPLRHPLPAHKGMGRRDEDAQRGTMRFAASTHGRRRKHTQHATRNGAHARPTTTKKRREIGHKHAHRCTLSFHPSNTEGAPVSLSKRTAIHIDGNVKAHAHVWRKLKHVGALVFADVVFIVDVELFVGVHGQ
jgi:hypothetical protein